MRSGWQAMELKLPRSTMPSASSFATSCMKRMQRVQRMQRSASSVMRGPSSTFFGFFTFSSRKRDSPWPNSTENSWRRHSPAWSQIGQSSGWLISRNSSTPLRASSTIGEPVRTPMPSATSCAHEICGRGIHAISGLPSGPRTGLRSGVIFGMPISTMHMRQLPGDESFGW